MKDIQTHSIGLRISSCSEPKNLIDILLEATKSSCVNQFVLESFKNKLRQLNVIQLQDLVFDLTKTDNCSVEFAKIIETNLVDENIELSVPAITPFAIKYNLPTLAESIRLRAFPNFYYISQLYRSSLLTCDVEISLVNELYKIYKDNGSFTRREIIETLQEKGTQNVLPILNVIEYELAPLFKSQKVIADVIVKSEKDQISFDEYAWLAHYKSMQGFYDDLLIAINLISIRPPICVNSLSNATHLNISPSTSLSLNKITQYIEKAENYLSTDPEASLNNMRKAIEAICNSLYDYLTINQDTKRNAKSFKNFDSLFQELKKTIEMPAHIILNVEHIQASGNYGSHDQDDFDHKVTQKIASSAFNNLEIVFCWYKNEMSYN
jgi:hypothetical protein